MHLCLVPILLLVVGFTMGPAAGPAAAQQRDRIEVQVGGGWVWHYLAPRHLGSVEVGLALWVSDGWGIAVRRVVAPGDSLARPADRPSDNRWAGDGNVRYTTVTARYRRLLRGDLELNVGFGLLAQGAVDHLLTPHETGRLQDLQRITEAYRGGGALELLVGRKVFGSVGVKGGFTMARYTDLYVNTNVVGLVAIGF